MFELKRISTAAIPRAIDKAERYRLLNEPEEAASICQDILQVDPGNQEVLAMLLLAVTDQFGRHPEVNMGDANRVLVKLQQSYDRSYYAGVIAERWGKAQLRRGAHHSVASAFFAEALDCYAKAMTVSPAGNDDAILRWNACVRFMEHHDDLKAETEEAAAEASFSDGAPAV
ncbi:MAG TPA: hypothetical protein VEP66_07555 [Myxococcales bacterium]|nr:hypothetical protein [Myxococcales bacterium]